MRPIDAYAAIGDGRSIALVSDRGAIDWLCWPRFDADPVFAALLDAEGGSFCVAPTAPFSSSRRYVEGTNVLVTTMRTREGTVEVLDFMPAAEEHEKLLWPEREIVRRVRCIAGSVEVAIAIEPRPSFGRERAKPRSLGHSIRWDTRGGAFHARCDAPLREEDDGAHATVLLAAGDRVDVSFSHAVDAPAVLPTLGRRVDERLAQTAELWRRFSARARYDGLARDAVVRSALALSLLCFAPSGAIVAAATTSLPEQPSGALNWDYRYCWLRDASLTARALLGLGYLDEAKAFVSWLLHATRLHFPRLRVVYDVYGREPPEERRLGELSGHFGARPVRVGNEARDQVQLDVYGEVVDAAAQLARCLGEMDRETQELLLGLGDEVLRSWAKPDHGIWEPRGPARHHTHSRLLCWVALDRILALQREGLLPPRGVDRYARARAAIRDDIEARAFHPRLRSYVGVLDGETLDASTLLLSYYGYLPADASRVRATRERVLATLGTRRGVLRYVPERGCEEGAFGLAGFWAVDDLARAGEIDRARALFDELLANANDVGLFAEEVDPVTGASRGNFPQAFTHVGLINAAMTLDERACATSSAARELAR